MYRAKDTSSPQPSRVYVNFIMVKIVASRAIIKPIMSGEEAMNNEMSPRLPASQQCV